MSSIDERIVEMQFDNAKFEKNINESIQSLEKLKKSLKIEDSGEAFQNIQNESKKVDFSHIEDGLDALNRRFSTAGIIGMQVIQSLTQEAIRLGGQLINAVTAPIKSDIVQGGWTRAMNLEQAKFQLEGLGHDADSVAHIMRNVDTAVSGTAYGLDEAALVASQLAASGIQAGESMGQLEHALLAVSGMAAMTGKSYGDIGHIMTTIAGNGRLMGMQLTQFSTYGLNVAAELAKSLGKTEGQIRDMVSKGAIDFTTFSEAMFNAYAKHAKNANKTLTGSISNVHAALKKIGQDFMTPLVENEGALTKVLNTIRLAINEVRNLTKPFADNVWSPWIKSALNGFDELINKFAFFRNVRPVEKMYDTLEKAGLSAKSFRKMLFEIGKSDKNLSSYKILSEFKTYEEFIDHYGNFRESLKAGWLNSDVIQAALKALNGETSAAAENTAKLNEEYETLKKLVAEVWRGDWGNGAERVKKMNAAGLDYAKIQALVNKCEKGRALTLEDLDEETLESIGVTKKQAESYIELKKQADEAGVEIEKLLEDLYKPTMLQMVGTTIGNIIGGIIDFFHILRDAIAEVFGGATYEGLYDFMYAIYQASFNFRMWNDETKEFTARGQGLKSIFKALFTVIKIVAKFIGGLVAIGFKLIQVLWPIGDAIIVVIGAIAQFAGDIISFVDSLGLMEAIFTGLGYVITPIVNGFTSLSNTITNAFAERLKKVSEFFKEVKEALSGNAQVSKNAQKFADALTKIKEIFDNLMQTVGKVITAATDAITRFFDTFKKNPEVERFVKNIQNLFGSIDKFASDKAGKIGGIFEKIFGKEFKLPSIEDIANFFAGLLKPINDLLEGKGLEGFFDNTSKAGKNFWQILENIVDSLVTILEKLGLFGTDAFSKLFGEFNWDQVVDVASVLSFVYLIKVIADYCKKIPAVNIFTNFSDVLGNLAGAINTYKKKLEYENIKAVALSIAAVAGVIYVLGTMDPAELVQGVAVLILIAVILKKLVDVLKAKKEVEETMKDKVDKSVITMRLGASFLMLAAGILLIISAMKMIADMAKEDINNLWAGVAFVAIAIGEIIGAFWLLKKLDVNELTKGSAAFVAMAFAIQMIAVAIGIMTLFNPYNLIAAAIALGGVIVALMFLVKELAKAEPKKIITASAAMVLIAGALAIIGAAISVMALLPIDRMWAPLVMLGVALAAMTKALVVLGKVGRPTTLLAGAAAIVMIALAMNMIIPPLLIFTAIASNPALFESFGLALLMFVGILTAFVVAGAFAVATAPGLMALASALLAFGASALLTASALLVLSVALPALAAGLAVMGTIIEKKAPEIALAILAIIVAIGAVISGAIPILIQIAGSLVVAFSGGILNAMPVIIYVLNMLMLGIGAFIVGAIPFLARLIVVVIIVLINSVAVAIAENSEEIITAVMNLLAALVGLIVEAVLGVVDWCAKALDGIFGTDFSKSTRGWMEDFEEWVRDDWMTDVDKSKEGYDTWDSYLRGMDGASADHERPTQKETLTKVFEDLKEQYLPGYSETKSSLITGATASSDTFFNTLEEENKKNAAEASTDWQNDVFNPDQMKELASQYGIDISDEMLSTMSINFEGKAPTEEELFEMLGIGGAGGSGTAVNPLIKPAVDFDAKTMSDAWRSESNGTVKPTIKTEASGWANAAKNEGAWQVVGRNNVQGLIRGMQSGLSAVAATARSIAESALNAAKAKLEQASPSKAFYRMGVYNDQGLINGMLFLRGKVEDASANVADSAINGAHYAIDRIQSIINSDMDMSPTIRPVFDDSLLQNGINTMSVWGNGYALNLAGSIGSVNLTQGQIFDDLNKRLDSRFEELSDRIDRISDRPFVANLTTTLDGREIARGTATYTNEEMNRITRNNNRKAGRRG